MSKLPGCGHDEADEDALRGKMPVPDDVQEAIRTLLRWAGDDPTREGLRDTPSAWPAPGPNIVRAFRKTRPST
jgi:GTP cyclohydrolase I